MRFRAAYQPADQAQPEPAFVEAASPVEAIVRLREVVGPATDVMFVVPAGGVTGDDAYERFLVAPEIPAA